MVVQIAYTHSNCQDLWEMFIRENINHTTIPLYVISDKAIPEYGQKDTLMYNNSDPYYRVWIDAVKKFSSDYFIYLQEDFVLYSDVNQEKINEYVDFLDKNPDYSFVRLLKSGHLYDNQLTSTLYEVETTNLNIFAMQATIWRSKDYVALMNLVKDSKWLENDNYRNAMIALNMKGAYHYDNEVKRGGAHYDSNVYPYIATALVKSKWDIREYDNELSPLLKKYNIDVNKRGIL